LLSFSLPFYSPPNFLEFTPALLAERVFNLMYSDTELSCQEESDVRGKKNEISALACEEIQNGGDVFEDQPPDSACSWTTTASAAGRCWA
jgi:hypothetical protein